MKIHINMQHWFRVALFCWLYFFISYYHADFTDRFHHYAFSINDSFLVYLFPLLVVGLSVFFRGRINAIVREKQDVHESLVFLVFALTIFAVPFVKFSSHFPPPISDSADSVLLAIAYSQFVVGNFFLFLAVFGVRFFNALKREVALMMGTVGLYILSGFLIELHWKFFSQMIVRSLAFIFSFMSGGIFINTANFNVRLEDFQVSVGPPCAGIYSLLTFLLLFLLTLVVMGRTQKIDYFKAVSALMIGLLITFLLNIVRITLIILVGAYVSEVIAIKLFHEYLSAVFLMALFAFYLYKVVPKILVKRTLH